MISVIGFLMSHTYITKLKLIKYNDAHKYCIFINIFWPIGCFNTVYIYVTVDAI